MSRQSEAPSCDRVLEHLEALVDGELDSVIGGEPSASLDAAAAAAHLESCVACAAEAELALAVRRELRALPQPDTPAATLASVLQRTAEAAAFSPHARRSRWTHPRRLAWAAIFVPAALGAGLWLAALQDWRLETRPLSPPQAPAADPEAVARATREARYALAYLHRLNRRAGLKLQQDLLIDRLAVPTVRTLSRSLSSPVTPSSPGTPSSHVTPSSFVTPSADTSSRGLTAGGAGSDAYEGDRS